MSTKNQKRRAAKKKRAGELAEQNASSTSSSVPILEEPTISFEEAIEEVEMMIEQSDLEQAEQMLRSQALLGAARPSDINQQHAHLVPAMELLAQVLIGMQKSKEAFQWLRACCALQPDGGAEKWMYYGQLIGGREALDAFKRGINCMFKTRQTITEKQQAAAQRAQTNAFTLEQFETPQQLEQQLQAINKQISSAYSCMAELYVTDLCDEDGAEGDCEKLLGLAISSFPDNPDALYALANLRTIQGRLPEACEVMNKLFAVLQACRAASIENMSVLALADDQKNEQIPVAINMADVSYELRVASAKLALELQAYEPALTLLDQLLEEDDRILEVSHLAAVCAFHLNQFSAALEHIERAEGYLSIEDDNGMMAADEDEEAARQAMEHEEIEVTKRAISQLKQQVVEAMKNAPPEPEEPEGEGEAEADGEEDQDTSMQD